MRMSIGWGLLVSRCGWGLPGVFFALLSVQVSAAACTAPAYQAGTVYEQGNRVQNKNQQDKTHEFECWKDTDKSPHGPGSWQWCNQPDYNPGQPSSHGVEIWGDAWKDLGECGGFQGNRLTLNFSTLSGRGPISQPTPGVARDASSGASRAAPRAT